MKMERWNRENDRKLKTRKTTNNGNFCGFLDEFWMEMNM